jgi:hypothetical protein
LSWLDTKIISPFVSLTWWWPYKGSKQLLSK